MQHWSLDVQQQLTPNTIVTIGYYGSKGTNLIGAFEENEIPAGYALSLGPTGCADGSSTTPTVPCQVAGTAILGGTPTNRLDQLRPFRGFRSVNLVEPRFNSSYHSLQVFAQQRFARGSQINLAYTWSKNLTDNQTDRSTAPQNSFDISQEWGRAAFDRRHILTVNWVYELPFYSRTRGFAGALLGGWEFQGIATYQTGIPFTVTTSSYDPAGLGFISALIAGGRPNAICNPNANAPQTQQQWFDISCFERNSPTNTGVANIIGTTGRGTVFGPPTKRVDFTLSKNFRFSEDMRLQLRAETFNVFNWTNFTTLSTNVTATTFGQVTGARDPRTFQFGIKFYF
jgi:hypothetical protein